MPSSSTNPGASACPSPSNSEAEEVKKKKKKCEISMVPGTPSSSTATSPSTATTINLSREYTLAIQTASYQEIWAKIHPPHRDPDDSGSSEGPTIAHVLQPDRASIEEILRAARPTRMTQLIGSYLENSESTSLLCLSLQDSIARARALYCPIGELLELVPGNGSGSGTGVGFATIELTPALSNKAFDVFVEFDSIENPFPSSFSSSAGANGGTGTNNGNFQEMRGSFQELKEQLDERLQKAKRRHRILCRTTQSSGLCLIACTTGITIFALVLASHVLPALMAGCTCIVGGGSSSFCDPFGLHVLREAVDRLDLAARNTYVLDNDLATIERLVARLHDTVEDDRKLVRLGVEGGRERRRPIEHVVGHLGKNYCSVLQQLSDLDEHICLYFASVNRVRNLLVQHIHQPD